MEENSPTQSKKLSIEEAKAIIDEYYAEINSRFDLDKICFAEQLKFINDQSPFISACCSRRAGKTEAAAHDLINTSQKREGTVSLYVTLSRSNAKKLIWPVLLRLNREYNLQGRPNETDLSLTFEKKNTVIYCSGAKDKSEIEKFRGMALVKSYIDEAQSFRPYIQDLVDDVISKALYDYDGQLRLTGTPGPVPAGFFYDACHSNEWSKHVWTMHSNPWLFKKSGKTAQELIERDLKRKGVTIDDPSIQRECFGRWVVDPNALVFRYSKEKNHFDFLPQSEKPWDYVLGIDLGFDDADAIAVIGWNEKLPNAYLVEEIVKTKQGITELVGQIEKLITTYNPMKIVMDTGGLGKKIAEEIRRRYSIPILAAEKARKYEFIEILNDAMRTNRFFARSNGAFAQDCQLVEWDKDIKLDKPKISDGYHSDICDSVLYAYREALNFLHVPEVKKPDLGTPQWFTEEEKKMEETAQEMLRERLGDTFTEGLEPSDWYTQ